LFGGELKKTNRCVLLCLHDDWWFVRKTIDASRHFGPVLAVVSRRAWSGESGNWEKVVEVAQQAGAEVILGDWTNETDHRREAIQIAVKRGFKYALIPDGDEVFEPKLLQTLIKLADSDIAERVHAHMDTYWKSARYVIRPREQLAPAILLNLAEVEHVYIRDFQGGRSITLGPEHGVIHHLSYAGPDDRILRKISTWSHKHEVVHDWYRNVWQAWDSDKLKQNLHPTHPQAYGFTERIDLPEILAGVWDERPVASTKPDKPTKWPTVSIVIPLHGGDDDIRMCLESLKANEDLIHETIVVDDASPDNAKDVAKQYKTIILENETNQGFAKTCNRGYEHSTGEVVLFLNSDTIVPRVGLIQLVEGLMKSGSIGAAGPMSNNVGYHQRITPTYTSLETLDNFAADLGETSQPDRDVEILVGFAFAVRRSVLQEIGAFDERFPRGMFEDTDLCYRISRAGYKLKMIISAYVHHWGSRTLQRVVPDMGALLNQNGELYKLKWKEELECGYASHLPGFNLNGGLVTFNEERHPDRVKLHLKKLRAQAKISLCMIVKNEERVLANCLKSARPFFHEIIVVDTGSTDRTKEIAREFGVKLIESTWPDSFAEARNESLKHATGDWIFWLDADDVLPLLSGEAVLDAAINAPIEITGFVVPVQFVEEGPNAGTRVDHVKLIRNYPGIKFEGRIHEQILSSIREHGGEISRLNVVVLHAGYDTSTQGQKKKRERDWHLLDLDLKDRPEHPFVWFNIGMTHHFSGQHEEAVEALKNSIKFSGEQDSHLRKAFSLMGVSYREMNQLDDSVQAFIDGLNRVGEDPELTFQLAMTATARGDLFEAKRLYEQVPRDTGEFFSSIDIGILTFKRLHNLAGIKMALGDYIGARQDWQNAYTQNPRTTISLYALCDAALEFGDNITAHQTLDQIAQIDGMGIEWAERRVRFSEQTNEPGGAMPMLDYFVRVNPQAIGPRMLLVRHMLNREMEREAIPHLHHLERQDVPEAAYLLGISALRANDIQNAIALTQKAVDLNPGHEQSLEQLDKLLQFTTLTQPSILSPEEQTALLVGPGAGTLKKATRRHTIIIVTYNSAEWVSLCLASLLPTITARDEVIVVDNASTDNTVAVVSAIKSKNIRIIRNESNIGYAPAVNVGVRESKGEFITLLNPDTTVTSGWLEGMQARITDSVGAIGPVSDNIGGAQFIGHYIEAGVSLESLPNELKIRHESASLDSKLIMGMCMMSSREVFNQVGFLDETLFLGADDLEFSWRLQSLGFKLTVALDVFVHHEGHKSFETRDNSETSILIAKSDAHLVRKLEAFYGLVLPTSYQIWSCNIFDEAISRRLL
jgi:GT2 family glycosyltransferase/tetratricopeptide (TPR) repeat protein